MQFRTVLRYVCMVMFVSGFSLSARAQSALVASEEGNFGLMDLSTGTYTEIGSTDPVLIGLGYSGGKLYAIGVDGNLYIVDPTNAQLTLVGNTGISSGYRGMGATYDGTLYAYTTTTDDLYSIDPATGTAQVIGSLGFPSSSALQGDDSGNLYMTGGGYGQGFYKINRDTGAATLIGTATYGQVDALAFAAGHMYGLNFDGEIYKIDLAHGRSTQVGTFEQSQVGNPWAAVSTAEAHKLTIMPSTVTGSLSAKGTLWMDGPVLVDTVVQLATSSADASVVPTSVTVPAGANSQTFTINTIYVTSPVKVRIKATSGRSITVIVTVTPIGVKSLTLAHTSVIGGHPVSGKVVLATADPSEAITVTLTSSDTSVATVSPSSIKIPVGKTTASFTVKTVPVSTATKVTIEASANGIEKSKGLIVTP